MTIKHRSRCTFDISICIPSGSDTFHVWVQWIIIIYNVRTIQIDVHNLQINVIFYRDKVIHLILIQCMWCNCSCNACFRFQPWGTLWFSSRCCTAVVYRHQIKGSSSFVMSKEWLCSEDISLSLICTDPLVRSTKMLQHTTDVMRFTIENRYELWMVGLFVEPNAIAYDIKTNSFWAHICITKIIQALF